MWRVIIRLWKKKKQTKQNKTKKSNRLISNSEPFHLSQGEYSDFKWQGWSEDFFGWDNLAGIFGVFKTIRRFVVVPARILANKVQPNLFCFLEIFKLWKFGMGFFWGLILGPIWSSLSLEIRSIPLVFQNSSKWLNKETEIKYCSHTQIFLRYLWVLQVLTQRMSKIFLGKII